MYSTGLIRTFVPLGLRLYAGRQINAIPRCPLPNRKYRSESCVVAKPNANRFFGDGARRGTQPVRGGLGPLRCCAQVTERITLSPLHLGGTTP
jgi:hypothetical protein